MEFKEITSVDGDAKYKDFARSSTRILRIFSAAPFTSPLFRSSNNQSLSIAEVTPVTPVDVKCDWKKYVLPTTEYVIPFPATKLIAPVTPLTEGTPPLPPPPPEPPAILISIFFLLLVIVTLSPTKLIVFGLRIILSPFKLTSTPPPPPGVESKPIRSMAF